MPNNFRKIFNDLHPLVKLIFDILIVLLTFFTTFIILLIFTSIIDGKSVTEIIALSKTDIKYIKLLQGFYSFCLFLFPPFVAALFYSKNPFEFLGLNKKTDTENLLKVVLIIFFAIPVINFLGKINNSFHFPQSLSHWETVFRNIESQAEVLVKELLYVNTTKEFLINLFLIAALPAISEEIFFRGFFQKHLIELTKNHHFGIILTAFVFSAVHLQFFTFLPRFVLGIILGYLFYWSKSLWLPITAHFTNNAIAVSVFFYSHKKNISLDDKVQNVGLDNTTYLIIGTVLMIFFLWSIYKTETKKNG